ncbi:iron complex transport system permease protein [Georgenia satyanarayanai]|uniref:Iron complex transport system permease protein n=1 Tax=Georgenia satyanarayanai TaxID=860221 RepID=A0A2Y9APN5_9MICO|nr:iron ABC transporter permease [Georgenia satyanarayanai]PYF97254.1 iron complex transport system permease protein [Georgenia satyanarayanai]SSA46340.1 iron complex transport system permease protein [Georgenia satyanarayanai]
MTTDAPARPGARTAPAPVQPASQPGGLRRALGNHRLLVLVVAAVVTVAVVAGSTAVGTSGVTFADAMRILWLRVAGGTIDPDFAQAYAIVADLRLPRALLALAAGAALSVAGAVMQGLLRNPLVSPFTLGVSPAAAFGASLAILLGGGGVASSNPLVILSALACAGLVTMLVLGLASARKMAVATLLLLGIAVTQLFEALTAGLQYVANENTLQAIVRWTLGSVNDASWTEVRVMGAVVVVLLPLLLWFAKDMNAIAFAGDDAARSLGVNVTVVRVGLILVSVLLASVAVSLCGVIGFVGLVGPHIARLIIGANHQYLLPMSALSGGVLLVAADTIGRTVVAPSVVPVGIVVAMLGAPVFIYLIMTRRASK